MVSYRNGIEPHVERGLDDGGCISEVVILGVIGAWRVHMKVYGPEPSPAV
jgi:hypothetical protein